MLVCLVSLHHRHWHWLNVSLWRALLQLSIIPLGTWLVIISLLDLLLRLIAQTLGMKEILFSGCCVGCALSPAWCIHILPQLWIWKLNLDSIFSNIQLLTFFCLFGFLLLVFCFGGFFVWLVFLVFCGGGGWLFVFWGFVLGGFFSSFFLSILFIASLS